MALRSSSTRRERFCKSKLILKSLTIFKRAVSVLWFILKPDWCFSKSFGYSKTWFVHPIFILSVFFGHLVVIHLTCHNTSTFLWLIKCYLYLVESGGSGEIVTSSLVSAPADCTHRSARQGGAAARRHRWAFCGRAGLWVCWRLTNPCWSSSSCLLERHVHQRGQPASWSHGCSR